MREIMIGILSSMFFAVTFILNRSMELAGGSWMWSSSLRFFFMVPFLLLIVLCMKDGIQLVQEMKRHPFSWLTWSFCGFVLFYAPITYAAAYGPGWLVAGTWQLVIVAGVLLTPLFFHVKSTRDGSIKTRQKIPVKALMISLMILVGVILIQTQHAQQLTAIDIMVGVLPVVIAAFAYPLGNRKMMELCGERLNTFQRVLGMTIATLPFWLIISLVALVKVGPPSTGQLFQSFLVAVCSGVIATTLFFIATNRVRENQSRLAAVEATQSMQVLFVIMGEVALLSSPLPNTYALIGLMIIIAGISLHSFFSKTVPSKKQIRSIQTNEKTM